jgi:cytochrome b involved in lipid metabolism
MDATEAFEDVGHSAGARELLQEYLVGDLTEKEDIERLKEALASGQKQSGCASDLYNCILLIL